MTAHNQLDQSRNVFTSTREDPVASVNHRKFCKIKFNTSTLTYTYELVQPTDTHSTITPFVNLPGIGNTLVETLVFVKVVSELPDLYLKNTQS